LWVTGFTSTAMGVVPTGTVATAICPNRQEAAQISHAEIANVRFTAHQILVD
jgi:hypothetical protein